MYIIAALGVLAFILTILNGTHDDSGRLASGRSSGAHAPPSSDRVFAMADTTLQLLGVEKKYIRSLKNSNDVRVYYPEKFDNINFMLAMQDSLEGYDILVTSVENVKENNTIVQIKSGDTIIRSFVFRKEPVQRKEQHHR